MLIFRVAGRSVGTSLACRIARPFYSYRLVPLQGARAMRSLLSFAKLIDSFNQRFGVVATWLVLAACFVSAGNAMSRYAISVSSNAWLEVQWYMFAGIVMLGAAYTLNRNEHVRVDVLYGRLSVRTRAWIDLLGLLIFMMPATLLLAWMSWPFFIDAYQGNETSGNAGGLIRWPAKLLLPLGFALLSLQGVSEIIKRIAYLRGVYNMDTQYERPLQ